MRTSTSTTPRVAGPENCPPVRHSGCGEQPLAIPHARTTLGHAEAVIGEENLPQKSLVMRIFRPEVEAVLKMLGILTLIGLIVLPVAWGYGQRQQARAWQSIACSYRVQEVARRVPFITQADYRKNPCEILERLGLDIDVPH